MDNRPINVADLEACADVFYAADDELNARRGMPLSPRNRAALLRLFEHIVATSPQRAWLAERAGEVLGFGIAAQRGDMTFLSFLFVRPDAQARGIGRALLERAMAGGDYRAVCIGSMQPISAALYAAYGMVPRVPLYMFSGRPAAPLPDLPPGSEMRTISAAAVADLDRAVTGLTRPEDHTAWEAWQRQRFGLFRDDALVGYGYVQPTGRLGPVVVGEPALLLPFLGALMAQLPEVETWLVNVPGVAAEAFVALLKTGMRLEGPPVVYCATKLRIDHSRYLPATFALP